MNLMKFSKAKHQVLCLDGGSVRHTYRLAGELVDSSPAGKDLGVLVDENLSVIQWNPGLYEKQRGQHGEGGDSAPSLCSSETLPGVLPPALVPPAENME